VISSRRGFTLLELILVLAILAVAVAVLLPSLPGVAQARRNAGLRRLAMAVQATYEHATFKKKAWL